MTPAVWFTIIHFILYFIYFLFYTQWYFQTLLRRTTEFCLNVIFLKCCCVGCYCPRLVSVVWPWHTLQTRRRCYWCTLKVRNDNSVAQKTSKTWHLSASYQLRWPWRLEIRRNKSHLLGGSLTRFNKNIKQRCRHGVSVTGHKLIIWKTLFTVHT